MRWFKRRRRSDRPDPSRRRLGAGLEALEGRSLLSVSNHPLSFWAPTDLPVFTAPDHQPLPFSINGLVQRARKSPQASFVGNEGKIVSGKDRQGNEWTITVHGPGTVLVTDTSPNDGILDDTIDTIQLLNTDPNNTYVTGQSIASFHTPTDGTVLFNRLIATQGVKSVILNGFTLTQTVVPPTGQPNFSNTGVFLLGGTELLQFHNILGTFDVATANAPINIVIGDPSTPLRVAPIIRLDSIFNTVIDTNAAAVPTNPQTDPSVQILVNGQVHSLEIVSSTQHPSTDPAQELRGTTQRYTNPTLSPIDGAGNQFAFPIVGTTGRTSLRAIGVDHLSARGRVNNFTASRGQVPFQNSLSGLDHLGTARFGGNADAVGLDVNGPIGGLRFSKGLGDPTGTSIAATDLGIPAGQTGYPAAGLQGGLVTSTRIGHMGIRYANQQLQTASNPDFVQLLRQGNTYFFARPGNAMTSSTIVADGRIGRSRVLGNLVNSEIKSGFNYPSFAAGLEGTRSPSRIGRFRQRGNLVNGDVSATVRPVNNLYAPPTTIKGPGQIDGSATNQAAVIANGGVTPLGNRGAGFYARIKRGGYLPPPLRSPRNNGVLVR